MKYGNDTEAQKWSGRSVLLTWWVRCQLIQNLTRLERRAGRVVAEVIVLVVVGVIRTVKFRVILAIQIRKLVLKEIQNIQTTLMSIIETNFGNRNIIIHQRIV